MRESEEQTRPIEGYIVIDVEAITLPREEVYVLEQVGYHATDLEGATTSSGKFYVRQPLTADELVAKHKVAPNRMRRAIQAYEEITGDAFLHSDPHDLEPEFVVRLVTQFCEKKRLKAYAKNPTLERQFFADGIEFFDLEESGCPKYPLRPHDPMLECAFFAVFIPELRKVVAPTPEPIVVPRAAETVRPTPVRPETLFGNHEAVTTDEATAEDVDARRRATRRTYRDILCGVRDEKVKPKEIFSR
jgi:hypothetical protein